MFLLVPFVNMSVPFDNVPFNNMSVHRDRKTASISCMPIGARFEGVGMINFFLRTLILCLIWIRGPCKSRNSLTGTLDDLSFLEDVLFNECF